MAKVGRNDPCPCGSGKKYKKCCLNRDEARSHPPNIPPDVLRRLQQKAYELAFSGPQGQKVTFKGRTIRLFRGRLEIRKPTETFHEYVVDVLKRTLGQKWLDTYKRPNEQKHVVMRWIYGWHEAAARAMPPDHRPGEVFGGPATGEARALLALADDVYRLQISNRLPRRMLERLRNPVQFQGARYEVCAAGLLLRCGFKIEWTDERLPGKHCEFVARHPTTRDVIAVEAKSRHRPGVMNQPGLTPDLSSVRADVMGLFRNALTKDPGDMAFAIMIDLNLPHHSGPTLEPAWMEEMSKVLDSAGPASHQSPYTLVAVTNFGWHYDGSEPAIGSRYVVILPKHPRHPLRDGRILQRLGQVLHDYGTVSHLD